MAVTYNLNEMAEIANEVMESEIFNDNNYEITELDFDEIPDEVRERIRDFSNENKTVYSLSTYVNSENKFKMVVFIENDSSDRLFPIVYSEMRDGNYTYQNINSDKYVNCETVDENIINSSYDDFDDDDVDWI